MNIESQIKRLTDELLAICLNDGVQPSDLAEAAFDDDYKSIEIVKRNGRLITTLSYYEKEPEQRSKTLISMRYTYNRLKKLMRVEQKVGQRQYITQWDREKNINSILLKLNSYLSKTNNTDMADSILMSLPNDIRDQMGEHLKLVV